MGFPFKDFGYLRLYFLGRMRHYTIAWKTTWLATVGAIGGYVGLFLGLAVVDVNKVLGRLRHAY